MLCHNYFHCSSSFRWYPLQVSSLYVWVYRGKIRQTPSTLLSYARFSGCSQNTQVLQHLHLLIVQRRLFFFIAFMITKLTYAFSSPTYEICHRLLVISMELNSYIGKYIHRNMRCFMRHVDKGHIVPYP